MKTCAVCKIEKPFSEFNRASLLKDGHCYACRECDNQRKRGYRAADPESYKAVNKAWAERNPEKQKRIQANSALKAAFGITLEQKEAMILQQGGKCKICGGPMTCPHVDHNHETGKIRGILCYRCNHAIGLLRDSAKNCLAAAAYLSADEPVSKAPGS